MTGEVKRNPKNSSPREAPASEPAVGLSRENSPSSSSLKDSAPSPSPHPPAAHLDQCTHNSKTKIDLGTRGTHVAAVKRKYKPTQNCPNPVYLASEERRREKSVIKFLLGLLQSKSAGIDGGMLKTPWTSIYG